MTSVKNLVEYYDELFPVSENQAKLYDGFHSLYGKPLHFLRVCCGTGFFESCLAKKGHDVTGVDFSGDLIKAANLRRRTQLMSIRFFQMDVGDMKRFLGKNFYNIISILDNRILFLGGKEKIREFFFDCRSLIAPGGFLIVHSFNFENKLEKPMIQLPTKESQRARLFAEVISAKDEKFMEINLETGSGKVVPILKDYPVYPILPWEIEKFAEEAGFHSAEFYNDFDKSEFSTSSDEFVVIIR
jgi:SAM-dependent methyltransferase